MPGEETIQIAKRLRAKWPVDDPVVILFSGSLTHRKAPDTLLAAFAQVASSHSQICLQFVGDGPMLVQLKAEVERLEIADRVRFLGFRGGRELHAAYVSADLFVLPTRTHEGWGVVVQEALAAGLPVLLSSRVGSLADVMSAGAAAREFPPNDANSLASLLAEVAGNNSTRERMSGSARTTARSLDCHAATSLFSDLVVKLGPSRHPEHAVRQSTL
jgi:glycosyltransferase involved in cell wall biosynthesis